MTIRDIILLRLHNQHISSDTFKKPENVISWLGAVQAQDYAGAKWSVGLRLAGLKESDVDKAIADKSIIRTWPMRGTLHFIAAADVRWMLTLLTPRIISGMAGRNKQLELDEKIFKKSGALIAAEMEGGKQLMRNEVYDLLEKNGITTAGQRGIHIINYLAQTQLICHGVHNEKQPTYVLLHDWVPKSKELSQEEALAEITYRYFSSHGPATVQDFAWWTGLKLSDAREGLNSVADKLTSFEVEGLRYWLNPETPDLAKTKSVYLLPGFDEYMLGYTNRTLITDQAHLAKIVPGSNGMFMPTVVVNGRVEGLWKRSFKKNEALIQLSPFTKFNKWQTDGIEAAVLKFGKYLEKKTVIQ